MIDRQGTGKHETWALINTITFTLLLICTKQRRKVLHSLVCFLLHALLYIVYGLHSDYATQSEIRIQGKLREIVLENSMGMIISKTQVRTVVNYCTLTLVYCAAL